MYGTEASSEGAPWGQGGRVCVPPTFSIPEDCIDQQSAAIPTETEYSATGNLFNVDFSAKPPHVAIRNGSANGVTNLPSGHDTDLNGASITRGGTDSGFYDEAHAQEKLCSFLAAAEKHRARLLWLAKRITNSHEEAEDVVQHSMLKAFVNLSKFRGDSQMSTWLGAIVQNTAREHMRSQRGKIMLPLEYAPDEEGESAAHDVPDPSETPEETLAFKERQEMVRSAMDSLTESHRIALQLCVMEDVPYLHAAQRMDVSLSSMKSRVFRGKQLLKMAVSRRLSAAI